MPNLEQPRPLIGGLCPPASPESWPLVGHAVWVGQRRFLNLCIAYAKATPQDLPRSRLALVLPLRAPILPCALGLRAGRGKGRPWTPRLGSTVRTTSWLGRHQLLYRRG